MFDYKCFSGIRNIFYIQKKGKRVCVDVNIGVPTKLFVLKEAKIPQVYIFFGIHCLKKRF